MSSIAEASPNILAGSAGNGRRVLEQPTNSQIMSVKEVRALIRTTFVGTNQIVQRLVDLNVLARPQGRPVTVGSGDAYVRLFDEEWCAAAPQRELVR